MKTRLLSGMIQNRLRCLIYLKGNREKAYTAGIMNLQDRHLLQYPNVKLSSPFHAIALPGASILFCASTKISNEYFLTWKLKRTVNCHIYEYFLCISRDRQAVIKTEHYRVSSRILKQLPMLGTSNCSTSLENTQCKNGTKRCK